MWPFLLVQFAVEGVVGLSWGFGVPLYDVIRGTVVDYICTAFVKVLWISLLHNGLIRLIPRGTSIWDPK